MLQVWQGDSGLILFLGHTIVKHSGYEIATSPTLGANNVTLHSDTKDDTG